MLRGLAIGVVLSANSVFATPQSPMTFRIFDPCRGNASFCATRILASGVIEDDSHQKLANLIATTFKEALPSQPTIVFDSSGGSIKGGIALGNFIRGRGYDTALEKDVTEEYLNTGAAGGTSFRSIAKDTICASACSLAFLGGHTRSINPEARYGVHRFYSPNGDVGDSATQVTMTAIGLYIEAMGVDRKLLDLASLTASSDMHWLDDYAVRELRIDNTRPLLMDWNINADNNGSPSLVIHQWVAPNRQLILSLNNNSNGIAIAVIGVIGKEAPNQNRKNQFPIGKPLLVSFMDDQKIVVKATPDLAWRKLRSNPDGSTVFSGFVTITHSDLQKISRATKLRFDDGFPNTLSDLSFSTELTTKGLANGSKLLQRTRQIDLRK